MCDSFGSVNLGAFHLGFGCSCCGSNQEIWQGVGELGVISGALGSGFWDGDGAGLNKQVPVHGKSLP